MIRWLQGPATRRRSPDALLLCAVIASMWGVAAASAQEASYAILARHAEKLDGDDPDLTRAGRDRARALAHALSVLPVEAVYVSQYRRTRATAAPLAARFGLEPVVHEARDVEGLAARIVAEARPAVAVVGHSNTIPALLRALGVPDPPAIPEDRYDDLFVVRLSPGEAPRLLHLKYGAPAPPAGSEGGGDPGGVRSPFLDGELDLDDACVVAQPGALDLADQHRLAVVHGRPR
ncbi:MAG: histidine phosphatase family protein, partial [Gemmatimonadota bacterium]|nr:histidine phosphatase family protein [Gemmatimonadota bacterium]